VGWGSVLVVIGGVKAKSLAYLITVRAQAQGVLVLVGFLVRWQPPTIRAMWK
jgi:hypothetical protein